MAVWEPPQPSSTGAAARAVGTRTAPLPAIELGHSFAAMSAQRLLVFGGMGLILAGMLFGDIFAVFVLHQNGNRTGEALLAATQAVAAHNATAVNDLFASVGGLLEDRGTKLDTHVHMTDAGFLALLLALLQPYIALEQQRKKALAKAFLLGGIFLPIGIFLIHYVGMAYSPFPAIGWASVLADTAGALMIFALIGFAWGLSRYFRSRRLGTLEPEPRQERTWERRALLAGGTILVLLGFLHGAWYAGFQLYDHESREVSMLNRMLDTAAAGNTAASAQAVADFADLQAEKVVQIAAHSHIIEFGLLALMLSFVQPYVFLGSVWKRRWVKMLLAGSFVLPVFVLLESKIGLIAGGIADLGGLMVIVALTGMLVGVLRYTGSVDAQPRGAQ